MTGDLNGRNREETSGCRVDRPARQDFVPAIDSNPIPVQCQAVAEQLLSVEAAAERLDTTKPRFIRRLIAERRIEFVRVGRHVRISESVLAEFIEAGRIPPLTEADLRHKLKGVG